MFLRGRSIIFKMVALSMWFLAFCLGWFFGLMIGMEINIPPEFLMYWSICGGIGGALFYLWLANRLFQKKH